MYILLVSSVSFYHLLHLVYSLSSYVLDAAKLSDAPENGGNEEATEEDQVDNGVMKLNKAERRAKQKKIKKIAKKQEDVTQAEEVQPTPQAAVLVFFRDFTFCLCYSTVPWNSVSYFSYEKEVEINTPCWASHAVYHVVM